jgi:hypothetical protein
MNKKEEALSKEKNSVEEWLMKDDDYKKDMKEFATKGIIQCMKNLMIDENLTVEEASKRITLIFENGQKINLFKAHQLNSILEEV